MVLCEINVFKAPFLTGNHDCACALLHDTVFIYGITTPALTARRHRSRSAIADNDAILDKARDQQRNFNLACI